MKIVWDEPKRISNIEKHGFDFAALEDAFFDDATIIPAKMGRYKAIGVLEDGTIVVIFATLGTEAYSIISMRPARPDERRLYHGS
ncbi:MAG: BrnT family toxin [Brucella anthropi]